MPRYLIERQFTVGPDEMSVLGSRSRQLLNERFPSIHWDHSHVAVGDDGLVVTYCIYEAGNEDDLRSHAEELGSHSIMGITELVGDVTPEDFPA